MTAIVYLKTQNISWIEFTNELVYLTAIKVALGFERKIVKVYTIIVQNNVKSVLQWIPVQYNQPQILHFGFLKFLKTDSLHEKIQLVTTQAHYWIVEASLIGGWDSAGELQKDQTISKKNKSIIYQDIGVLSLHSATSNTAHENYSTENILYQEWHTRSMNNLSLLSLPEQASPQIRNEAKQKKNLKKPQAADTPFKQPTLSRAKFSKFAKFKFHDTIFTWKCAIHNTSVRHFWMECMRPVSHWRYRYLYFTLCLIQLDIEIP